MLTRLAFALPLALAAGPAVLAQAADPLKSEACKAALAQLEPLFAETASTARTGRIAVARDRAATACLGPGSGRGVRSGAPQPPQALVPPTTVPPATAPALPAVVLPASPLAIPRPTVITFCDAAGCWDSDGRRLDSLGPMLMGPRGPCVLQGGLANCP